MPRIKKSRLKTEADQKTFFLRNIVFCPQCKSTNSIKKMAPVGIANIGALGQMNICKDCGFEDKIFPEISENDKDKLEKLHKFFKKK